MRVANQESPVFIPEDPNRTARQRPFIMAAPNGARRGKGDHPALPITIDETVAEAAACFAVGADALHLHVRDADGQHSLDAGLYREALAELDRVVPQMPVQITTEAAGLFDVETQLITLSELRPRAASICVKDIARAPELAARVYGTCAEAGTHVQHILFTPEEQAQLIAWEVAGIVQAEQRDVIHVLGQYTPPVDASPAGVSALSTRQADRPGRWMVCAFGPQEHAVLLATAAAGGDLRVGFENNLAAPDGALAESTAANVAALRAALEEMSA